MANWSVSPSTNVSIEQSTGKITFPKNTGSTDIIYTISYTSDTNCTASTTYTIPKCISTTPPPDDCFKYYILEGTNNLNGAYLSANPTNKNNASPTVSVAIEVNEFGSSINRSGKYSFDVKRLRYHECNLNDYDDEYIPMLSLENTYLDGGTNGYGVLVKNDTAPTFGISVAGCNTYIAVTLFDGYIEIEYSVDGSGLANYGSGVCNLHFSADIVDVENHEDINIGSISVDLGWQNG